MRNGMSSGAELEAQRTVARIGNPRNRREAGDYVGRLVAEGKRGGTLPIAAKALQHLAEWLGARGYGAVNHEDLQGFLGSLNGVAQSTRAQTMSNVCTFYRRRYEANPAKANKLPVARW